MTQWKVKVNREGRGYSIRVLMDVDGKKGATRYHADSIEEVGSVLNSHVETVEDTLKAKTVKSKSK